MMSESEKLGTYGESQPWDLLPGWAQSHALNCDDCHCGEAGRVLLCSQVFALESRRLKAAVARGLIVGLPRVLNDRVLLRVIQREEEKRGSIILPDISTERPNEGEVLATGHGRILDNGKRVAVDLAISDRVFYGRYSGSELRYGDQKIIILREDEILAVLPDKLPDPVVVGEHLVGKTDVVIEPPDLKVVAGLSSPVITGLRDEDLAKEE